MVSNKLRRTIHRIYKPQNTNKSTTRRPNSSIHRIRYSRRIHRHSQTRHTTRVRRQRRTVQSKLQNHSQEKHLHAAIIHANPMCDIRCNAIRNSRFKRQPIRRVHTRTRRNIHHRKRRSRNHSTPRRNTRMPIHRHQNRQNRTSRKPQQPPIQIHTRWRHILRKRNRLIRRAYLQLPIRPTGAAMHPIATRTQKQHRRHIHPQNQF